MKNLHKYEYVSWKPEGEDSFFLPLLEIDLCSFNFLKVIFNEHREREGRFKTELNI